MEPRSGRPYIASCTRVRTSMRTTLILSASAALLTVIAACATSSAPPGPVSMARTDTVFVVDTVRVATASEVDPELEDQIARLQIRLLERDVVLEDVREQLGLTRQELVRNMAKLQSQASRAEAASGIAEAEIALEALEQTTGGTDFPEFARAESRLAESTVEFNAENYGGALYLATEARALARTGRSRMSGVDSASLLAGESLFALPVPLQAVSRSNVREGPGLEFGVRFTLEGGALLIGQSHTNQWVRVRDDEGREGWIFHTLVTGRGL